MNYNELLSRVKVVKLGSVEDKLDLIEELYNLKIMDNRKAEDNKKKKIYKEARNIMRELKEDEGILCGGGHVLDTIMTEIYYKDIDETLSAYYNLKNSSESFINDIIENYEIKSISKEYEISELEEIAFQELKRGLRDTVRDKYHRKYITGVEGSPEIDLTEGYFSRWGKCTGDNKGVWIFSYYDKGMDKLFYNYKDVDEDFVKYIKTEYRKDRGFLKTIDKSSFQLRDMNTELLFTDVQGYRKGIFRNMKKADIADEILKEVLGEVK